MEVNDQLCKPAALLPGKWPFKRALRIREKLASGVIRDDLQ
jgi:hypothetical protein